MTSACFLLRRILEIYHSRWDEIAEAVSMEMGAPLSFAKTAQVWAGQVHLEATIKALEDFEFGGQRGTSRILREAIGTAGLITPWNWAAQSDRLQSGACHSGGLHHGVEAQRDCACLGPHFRGDHGRGPERPRACSTSSMAMARLQALPCPPIRWLT